MFLVVLVTFCSQVAISFQFTQPVETPIYKDEVAGPIPEGIWRYGKPCEKAERIFMRLATCSDHAVAEEDLFRRNEELRESLCVEVAA